MRVTLHFDLDEEVTPELFVVKVAKAVSTGALRPGESVSTEDDGVMVTINEEEDRCGTLQ
jgi:hypothetical protein